MWSQKGTGSFFPSSVKNSPRQLGRKQQQSWLLKPGMTDFVFIYFYSSEGFIPHPSAELQSRYACLHGSRLHDETCSVNKPASDCCCRVSLTMINKVGAAQTLYREFASSKEMTYDYTSRAEGNALIHGVTVRVFIALKRKEQSGGRDSSYRVLALRGGVRLVADKSPSSKCSCNCSPAALSCPITAIHFERHSVLAGY